MSSINFQQGGIQLSGSIFAQTVSLVNSSGTLVGVDLQDTYDQVQTLAASQSTDEAAISSLTSQVSTIASNQTTDEAAISTLQSNYTSLSSQVSTIATNQATDEAAIFTLQSNYTSLSSQVSTIATNQTTDEANINSIQSSLSSLQNTVDGLSGGGSVDFSNLVTNVVISDPTKSYEITSSGSVVTQLSASGLTLQSGSVALTDSSGKTWAQVEQGSVSLADEDDNTLTITPLSITSVVNSSILNSSLTPIRLLAKRSAYVPDYSLVQNTTGLRVIKAFVTPIESNCPGLSYDSSTGRYVFSQAGYYVVDLLYAATYQGSVGLIETCTQGSFTDSNGTPLDIACRRPSFPVIISSSGDYLSFFSTINNSATRPYPATTIVSGSGYSVGQSAMLMFTRVL